MRLWFALGSGVPVYRQMVTQISLAILSGDLKPGEKLPSTRELARRFGLHPNTISAGYRQLEREGWVEPRHGSGVYVRAGAKKPTTPEQILDGQIAGFFRTVRELKLPPQVVRERVSAWLAAPEPVRLLVVDPDPEMRRILQAEIAEMVDFPVTSAGLDELENPEVLRAAVPLCRPSKEATVRSSLPAGVELLTLPIRSANSWLAPWLPAPKGVLLAVVSHWPEFLTTAETMLVAAGLPPESLMLRDARKPRWNRGLEQATAILCDAYTAQHPRIPQQVHTIVFGLLADSAREEMRRFGTLKL